MNFREWFYQDCTIILEDFINEVITFKGNVTRDKTAVAAALDNHLRKQSTATGGKISAQMIVDTIRHQFTTYDAEWRAVQKSKPSFEDTCDYIKAWNNMVNSTAALVAQFYQNYVPATQHATLDAANQHWISSKLMSVPQECEEEDDPRKYRRGYLS